MLPERASGTQGTRPPAGFPVLAAAQLSLLYFLDREHVSLSGVIFTSEAFCFLSLLPRTVEERHCQWQPQSLAALVLTASSQGCV